MDHHRKQAEQRAAVRTQRAQQKRLQCATEPESAPSWKKARTHDEKAGPSTRKRTQPQLVLPDIASAVRATNRLIVVEQRHQNYEAAAMDTYINARSRGICRRQISDEFFRNRPGMCLCSVGRGIPRS